MPIKGERGSQDAVRIPKRKVTLVNLGRCRRGPRNHCEYLVLGRPAMDRNGRLLRQSKFGKNVVRAKVNAMDQGGRRDGAC